MTSTAPLIILSTCPDRACADALAGTLVAERLAACVTIVPGVSSIYRWQGRVERSDELMLLIKTAHDRFDALADRLRALHPYELPEIIAVEPAGGLAPYLDWVVAQTRDRQPATPTYHADKDPL